jgi:hypothetical protein
LRNPANLIKGLQKLPNWYPHASGQQEGQIKNHTKRGPTTNKERANSSSKERTIHHKPKRSQYTHLHSQQRHRTKGSQANKEGKKPKRETPRIRQGKKDC